MRCTWLVALTVPLLCGCGEQAGEVVEGVGQQVDLGGQTAVNVQLALLRQQLAAFKMGQGRFPTDLDELATVQHITPFPTPPPGWRFTYDAATGQLDAARD